MATREISTTLKLEGEKAFNDQMKAVNNNLKNLRGEMAVVTSEFAENADSVEALTAKQKNLAAQVDQQKVKVEALNRAYEESVELYGESSSKADNYRQQMLQAQAALNKMQRELDGVNDDLEDHEKQLEETAKAQEKTAKTAEKLKKALKEAAENAAPLGKGLAAAGKAAGALTAAGGAAVAALGALSVVGVAKMAEYAKEAAEAGTPGFETLAENLTALDSATASAKAALGGVLLPALEELSADGGKLLDDFTKEIEAAGNDPEKLSAAFSGLIKNGVSAIRKETPQMIELGMSLVEGLAEGAVESGPELFDMASEILGTLLDGLESNADSLADAAVMLVTELVNFLGENSPDLLLAGVELVSALVTSLAEQAPQLVPAAVSLISGLLLAVVQNAPLLISAGADLIGGLLEGLFNSLPDLVAFIPQMIVALAEALTAAQESLADLGEQIIDKIWEGLKAAWARVKEWFNGVLSGLSGNVAFSVGVDGSHAGGLNYVPFDGYIAELHKGEMVVPAREAQQLRTGAYKAQAAQSTTVNIYTQNLSEAQIDYIYKRFNAKLGAAI